MELDDSTVVVSWINIESGEFVIKRFESDQQGNVTMFIDSEGTLHVEDISNFDLEEFTAGMLAIGKTCMPK